MDRELTEVEIVLTDDYLQTGLAEANRKALQAGRSWMLVKPLGTVVWIGPIFVPGKTGCWECLAQRLRVNRPVETYLQNKTKSDRPFPTSFPVFPSLSQTGTDLAASEIVKWILRQENQFLEGKLVTFDTLSLELRQHTLVQRPQCPACGSGSAKGDRDPEPIRLQRRPKTFTADGGHRVATPEETLRKYEHHYSPITGAVRKLERMSMTSDGLMHLYYSGNNFARMNDDLYFLRHGCRSQSAGKGKTDAQAKASALCEALERFSGMLQGGEICRTASYGDLGGKAIHPNDCLLFSEAQYQNRQTWNEKCASVFNLVAEPFDEIADIEWTPIWSLGHQTFKYLPTAYCYYGYPHYPKRSCPSDSNGNAAGNTKEEAIVQGFMELVERDSIALWWYNRVQRPSVDLGSFDEPYLTQLSDYYQTLDRELWVLDLTSDLNIPVFVALSRRTDKPVEDILLGFGAHFDPKIAVLRAVTEMNQMLPAVSTLTPDGKIDYQAWDDDILDWWTTATIANQPYLVPDSNATPKTRASLSHFESDDLLDDVTQCVEIARQQGLDVLVLDQTRPDIELNVVKVIVPGLRHFWRRLAPGRLYDIPVKLGWLSEPIAEEDLNPISVFL